MLLHAGWIQPASYAGPEGGAREGRLIQLSEGGPHRVKCSSSQNDGRHGPIFPNTSGSASRATCAHLCEGTDELFMTANPSMPISSTLQHILVVVRIVKNICFGFDTVGTHLHFIGKVKFDMGQEAGCFHFVWNCSRKVGWETSTITVYCQRRTVFCQSAVFVS